MSWSTSELRVRLAPLNRFKPSSKIFYWPFQGGTSFVDLLCFCSVLCLLCFVRVCLYVLRGHLLGKGWPLGSRLWCLLWVCHFPIGILGQVWYLIVSIPDLCNLTYLHLSISNDIVSTKVYDKRDDFNFEIVNFPFLDGDVPHSTSYGVYISQLFRFARASSYVTDFNTRYKLLTQKLSVSLASQNLYNFIDDTMIWYLNSNLDLNLSCAKDFWNLNSMVTWWLNWSRLLALIIFQRSSLK